jgi:hypothetical protein
MSTTYSMPGLEKMKDLGRKIITVQHHKITHLRGNTTSHISEEFMCCMGMEYVVDMENINKCINHNII